MRAVQSKTLGERIFGKKLKASKTVCNKGKLNLDAGVDEQPRKKSKMEVEKQKWKMDLNVKGQCVEVLDALLSHRYGFVFKCPVDPVALNLPDYLTVISHPMDLGTIKSKLTANAYRTAQEFAGDVKLTFSNAMLYSPPDNQVHSMAKELDGLFLKEWKVLEAKWNHGVATCSLNPVPSKAPMMSMDEKKKLKEDLIEIPVGRTAEKFRSEFGKLGLEIPRKEVIDLEFDKFDEHVLLLLKRVVKDSKADVLSLPETTQSAPASKSNGEETDLKKALVAARAAMIKNRSADFVKEAKAIPGKVQQDAPRPIEARPALETCSKRNVDEYDQLLELCGCSLSYDSHIGVVLRLREVKTRKLVDPLASIGLKLKKQFVADATDYGDYRPDVNLEEVEARRIEERNGRATLETSWKKNVDEDKVVAYDQLLVLCGCSLSYDSHIGVVLRLRDFKTGKLVDPLARIGLQLKKEFIADATNYDDYVDMDLEEGEILDSDRVLLVCCDMEVEEGEILE